MDHTEFNIIDDSLSYGLEISGVLLDRMLAFEKNRGVTGNAARVGFQ